jgi:hypothetical protein
VVDRAETVIAQNNRVGMVINGKDQYFESTTVGEKRELYDAVYRYLLSMKTDEEIRRAVRDLCATYSLDLADLCHDECMDWSELSELAADPLCTIGAHTVNHMILKKVPSEKAVRAEMEMSRAVIEAALGKRPEHLAYPMGDRASAGPREFRIAAELGFKTAVTTRPGVLFKAHLDHLTALPRIPVNGEFQQQRYLKVLMSGAGDRLREPVPARQRGLGSGVVRTRHPADQGHRRQNPAEASHNIIERCHEPVDVGQHRLCKGHRNQAPYGHENKQGDRADEFARAYGHGRPSLPSIANAGP